METTVDAYGFELRLSETQKSERIECSKDASTRLEAWRSYHDKNKLPTGSKLKKLVRKGIPDQYRQWAWPQISGANVMKGSYPGSYFSNMVNAESKSKSIKQIELDLPRTFPQHPWLQSAEGQQALRNVLVAFSVHNSRVGYCQSLNFVAGLLLLSTSKNEEATFWLLAALVEKILYANTYCASLVGYHVEMRTLDWLISRKLPRLHRHFQDIGCEASLFATDWFLCLFATTLPCEVVMRIWDVLLHEGSKVLYRVALALLQLHEADILKVDNAGEVMRLIKDAASSHHHHDHLMSVAFGQVGGLPMTRISRKRAEHQPQVEQMMREREAARRQQEQREQQQREQQQQQQQQADEQT